MQRFGYSVAVPLVTMYTFRLRLIPSFIPLERDRVVVTIKLPGPVHQYLEKKSLVYSS